MKEDSRIPLLSSCYKESKRFREKDTKTTNPFTGAELSNPWYYYDRMYRGFMYDLMSNMASWASRPYKNIVAMAVESMTTMLTDNNPAVSIVPRESADSNLAEVVKAAVEHWWDIEQAQGKIALAVKSSRIFGIGWLRTYYDESKKRMRVQTVPADSVWVDPDCTVEEFDPNWLIFESRMSKAALMALYPDGDYKDFDTGWTAVMGSDRSNTYDRYADNSSSPAKTCAVYELWYKDNTLEDWEKDLGDSTAKGKKLKYKGGRRLVYAGGQCLKDEKNPYDHGEIPFTPVHAYPVPGRFYGFGDVQNVMNIQVMRNRMSQFIFDQTMKSGGGFILVGKGSGIDPNKVTNAPIQVLPCKDVSQFRVERAPAPSRHVFDYIGMLDKDADDVIGIHDISRGVFTPGNKTANEVAVMAESDRTRVRMASRWLTWALRRVLRQVLSGWVQWDNSKMMVRIAGKDLIPDAESPDGMSTADRYEEFSGSRLKRMGEDGKLTKDNIEFDIVIADTSTLPASQQEKNNLIGMLLQMGVIAPPDVLKYKLLDIPHAAEIMADHEREASQAPPQGAMPPGAMPPPEGEMPPMEAPAEPDPSMMGAMGPLPEGMSPEMLMQMVEQIASETGLEPDAILDQLGI